MVNFGNGKRDHIENFKMIVSIMKRHGLEKINVVSWDPETKTHRIEGGDELKVFVG